MPYLGACFQNISLQFTFQVFSILPFFLSKSGLQLDQFYEISTHVEVIFPLEFKFSRFSIKFEIISIAIKIFMFPTPSSYPLIKFSK